MPRIELSAEEAATMRQILESYLGDLRMEIADTDAMEYRTELKEREALLKSVIERLRKG
jgi:hypothetical protein